MNKRYFIKRYINDQKSKNLGDKGSAKSSGASEGPVALRQEITVVAGVAVIVGTIIGSGIFITPGNVLKYAGSPGLAIVVWFICGVFCTIGAVCFSELGTMIPETGGDYVYILTAFGSLPAFVTLWINVFIIRPSIQSVISLTFAEYAVALFFPNCPPPRLAVKLLAATALVGLTAANCLSVPLALTIQKTFAFFKLLALSTIIIAGFVYGFENQSNAEFLLSSNAWTGTHSVGSVALALYQGLFAYMGWHILNYSTKELKDPVKNLPKVIWISLPLVTTTIIMVNLAYFFVLTREEFLASNAVAVAFALKAMWRMHYVIPVFVALSTLGSLNGVLFASSRLFFAGSQSGHLPRIVSFIHPRLRTPIPALIFTTTISLVMVNFDLVLIINYMMFSLWLSIGGATGALLWLRRSRPELIRPVKVNVAFPAIFMLCCLFLIVVPIVQQPTSTLIGLLLMLSSLPVYVVGVIWKKPKCLEAFIRHSTIFLQKVLCVVESEENKETFIKMA